MAPGVLPLHFGTQFLTPKRPPASIEPREPQRPQPPSSGGFIETAGTSQLCASGSHNYQLWQPRGSEARRLGDLEAWERGSEGGISNPNSRHMTSYAHPAGPSRSSIPSNNLLKAKHGEQARACWRISELASWRVGVLTCWRVGRNARTRPCTRTRTHARTHRHSLLFLQVRYESNRAPPLLTASCPSISIPAASDPDR